MTHARYTTTRSSYRSHAPKSEGNDGEIGSMQAFAEAGVKYQWQVPIQTKFREVPFKCDFLFDVDSQPWITTLTGKQVVGENQGGFHFKTFHGRPAVKRRHKDEMRMNCLTESGYTFVEWREEEIVTRRYRKGIKTLIVHPDTVLDRLMQAFEAPKGSYFLAAEGKGDSNP